MDEPRRRYDPAAVAVNLIAIAILIGASIYLAYSFWKDASAPKKPAKSVQQAAKTPKPVASAPTVSSGPVPPAPVRLIAEHGTGRRWSYRVSVEPAMWRDAMLHYRISDSNGQQSVVTQFLYAGGEMSFFLGTFAANHPSHASTRFPGFFLYAAYMDRPLNIGERFAWEWPWQLPDGQVRQGRVKRYTAEVKEWGSLPAPPSVKAPAGNFAVARIAIRLAYVEDGVERAAVNETVWYAWRYMQVVKIVREGKTPDEAVHHIVAELVEHTYQ